MGHLSIQYKSIIYKIKIGIRVIYIYDTSCEVGRFLIEYYSFGVNQDLGPLEDAPPLLIFTSNFSGCGNSDHTSTPLTQF